jgi:hypothetical protein
VRIALGKPDGMHVSDRGAEEGIGDGMSARIRTALIGFRPVVDAGAELRLHDTVLYKSLCRADDELLVNTHVYGTRRRMLLYSTSGDGAEKASRAPTSTRSSGLGGEPGRELLNFRHGQPGRTRL